MKSLRYFAAALVCGLGLGWGTTWVEFANELDEASASTSLANLQRINDPVADAISDQAKKGPVATVLGETYFDFGTIERTGTGKHIFQIRNDGDEVLTVKAGATTCKCTLSEIGKENYQPGEIAEILVEWNANVSGVSPEFEQSAAVHTNDPTHPTIDFRIRGLVTESLRAVPVEVVLGSVPSNQGMVTEFRLFGSRVEEVQILESQFVDAESADFFDVKYEPLSEEEVAEEKGVDCGVLATLTIKSGLPLGPIRQTIRIKADAGKEVEVAIPITGRVTGEILIPSTAKFDSRRNLLNFGVVPRSEGAKTKLFVFVKGEHHQDVELTVATIEPKGYVEVEIGPPVETLNGKTTKYLITFEVPPGLEPINRLGASMADYGHVVIETTHPTSKQISINVKFAVE
jgi:hypothetical protein